MSATVVSAPYGKKAEFYPVKIWVMLSVWQ
jgi:hypothetical protein